MLAVVLNAQSLLLVPSLQDLARVGHTEGTRVGRQEGAKLRHQERGRMGHMTDVSMCGGYCVEGRIGGFLRCNLV